MPEVKILFFDPAFFTTPPKKIRTEDDPIINRTYFLKDGKIVAVGDVPEV